jgi:uncharacterized protein with ParB-like and HNH nuclease domain
MKQTTVPPIDARRKSVKELLNGQKYTIDYYQREYQWQREHIQELLEDLNEQFMSNYQPSHERTNVEHYSHYFLGSIVVSSRNGQKFIIDGQQRLTSLTLLLIFLQNSQVGQNIIVDVSPLIFSEKFGKKSFNLDVPERTPILEALHNNDYFDTTGQNGSVQTIDNRYQDIVTLFPENLRDNTLPYFIDWLTECVDFVEITAFSDDVAYTIFETMNDRGLSLSPSDMLKGYLLANLDDDQTRDHLNRMWKEHLSRITDVGVDDVSDFFKSWLRGRHAKSIRGSTPGEQNKDWEKIVTSFHKWVREERGKIDLNTPEDFRRFVQRDFDFYARQYTQIRHAAASFTYAKSCHLEYVHYNANNGYTLQYPLIISALRPDDSAELALRKIRVVSGFVDIFIARRFVNFKTIALDATKSRVFNWITSIRDMDVNDIIDFFLKKLEEMDAQGENFDAVKQFNLHQQNRQRVHHLLARITYALETWTGAESSFDKYSSTKAKTRYEIEHIWANQYERHKDEFDSETTFSLYRNRFGGLILLPRGTNQSYNDHPYEVKIRHYIKENLLVQSLHSGTYEKNPNFTQLIKRLDLPFRSHAEFKKKDLDDRQFLYQKLCEEIWSPQRLEKERI